MFDGCDTYGEPKASSHVFLLLQSLSNFEGEQPIHLIVLVSLTTFHGFILIVAPNERFGLLVGEETDNLMCNLREISKGNGVKRQNKHSTRNSPTS